MIYFFRCSNEDDYSLAVPYYKMARVLPAEVLKRVKKIQEQSGNHVIFLLFVLLLKIISDINILFLNYKGLILMLVSTLHPYNKCQTKNTPSLFLNLQQYDA